MGDSWDFIYRATGFDALNRYSGEGTYATDPHGDFCETQSKKGGIFGGKSFFEARLVGLHSGTVVARSTKTFGTHPTNKGDWPDEGSKSRDALDELIEKLISDGWRFHAKNGDCWWKLVYRRDHEDN